MVPIAELVTLQRSAAMVSGQTVPISADVLEEMCAELIEARQLLEQLGGNLRAVANKSRRR